MMAKTLAEQFRAARENFELARELGCTPAEAATWRRRREADLRLRAKMAVQGGPSATFRAIVAEQDEPPAPAWWQREQGGMA